MAQVYKTAGTAAARVAGDMPEMDAAMGKVRAAIQAEAAKHILTGAFSQSIKSGRVKGKRGVTDRAVWTDTPEAWSIEFGHLSGKRGGKNRRHVPGKFIFTNGAKRAGG